MIKTIRFLVEGLVQGVGYRNFVFNNALGLGLNGFVKNCDDGKVEVVVNGEAGDIETLKLLLKKGSPHSNVKNVLSSEIVNQSNFNSFKIII